MPQENKFMIRERLALARRLTKLMLGITPRQTTLSNPQIPMVAGVNTVSNF
jgi:hypothetical protein